QRLELLAEGALVGINGTQIADVFGGSERLVRDRVRRGALARRRVGQPPHLREALRARLRLEEIPAERLVQTQRLPGEAGRGVLGREVVQPERDGYAVDRLAAECLHHAFTGCHFFSCTAPPKR